MKNADGKNEQCALEQRVAVYDRKLAIEAYWFHGVMQKFPNHFHEYYVIAFIEKGKRRLSCKNKEYFLGSGDMILLNPLENHTCEQMDKQALDYRAINVKPEVMESVVRKIYGTQNVAHFTRNVIIRSEYVDILRKLHRMILDGGEEFEKEELFYFFMLKILTRYANKKENCQLQEMSTQICRACDYMSHNYMDTIVLDELCEITGIGKYTLLRNFTSQKGVTPYQYLESIRVNHAKMLLANGHSLIDTAVKSGFSDQSHFTRFFKNFIGLTPKQYQKLYIKSEKESMRNDG